MDIRTFLKRAAPQQQTPEAVVEEAGAAKRPKTRLYNDDYLRYGFSWRGDAAHPDPVCLLCPDKLSNAALVPSKLLRHLETKHPQHKDKDVDYFRRLKEQNEKQSDGMRSFVRVSEKAQEASFLVAELVAKTKKPHTIAETLILPACKILVGKMLGPDAVKEVEKVRLSDDTIKRRIDDMSKDVESVLCDKLRRSGKFSLQVDDSTDLSGHCQLIANVRYVDEDDIKENFLFCKPLENYATGDEVFKLTDKYFRDHDLSWDMCVGICTDGAASMVGRVKGFVTRAKEKNPTMVTTHCMLHREALMAKAMPPDLKEVLDRAVQIVNYVKSRPLKTRLFSILCKEMDSEHQGLLFHTEVRWLSRGNTLKRIYELREELVAFSGEHDLPFKDQIQDDTWWLKVAYLADIFGHMNELNTKMQGKKENILTITDRINGFRAKLGQWQQRVSQKHIDMFTLTAKNTTAKTARFYKSVSAHLASLEERFEVYFPPANEKYDWIRDPFHTLATETASQCLDAGGQDELAELQMDRTLRLKHNDLPLDSFWVSVRKEYPTLSENAISVLIQFPSSYLCELAFSSLTYMKNKHRQRMSVEHDLRVALSTIPPRIKKLCNEKQAHVAPVRGKQAL